MWINVQRGEKITSRQLPLLISILSVITSSHTHWLMVFHVQLILMQLKESWPNSTCVGSPYLAAKSLNYARRMRPSWKLKRLQQASVDICIWWKFNPILSGQSTFHLLQFQKLLPGKTPWKGPTENVLHLNPPPTSMSAPKQQAEHDHDVTDL